MGRGEEKRDKEGRGEERKTEERFEWGRVELRGD